MRATRFLWVLMLASGLAMATNIDGTITYQAQIKQNGTPANGTFDFQFRLFDSATVGVGVQHGQTVPVNDVAIVNGQLSTNLNFDNPATPFDGTELFLEVGIRPGNSQPNDPYTLLNPRQRLTEVPYATHTVLSELALTVPNGSITNTQLAANSVNSSNIIDGAVGTLDLANGAVTGAKVDATTVQKRVTPGCAAGTAVQTVNQDGTVACVAVGGGGGGGTVTSITAGSGLTGGTITTVGTIGIANGGITGAMIADGTITGADIAAATITGADIAASTITNTNINTSLVQQRVVGTCTGAAFVQTIGADGSVTCATASGGGGTGWGLTGNAGTSPATNFIGTTDNQAIVIRANNQRAAQFQMVTDTSSETGVNVLLGSASNSITSGVTAATIGGGGFSAPAGLTNAVSASGGTISGGFQNVVSSLGAAVGGGFTNTASAQAAVVVGGSQNHAGGNFSAVLGGTANTATGTDSVVVGGRGNQAPATNSVVIGNCARVAATDSGAILIAAVQTSSSCGTTPVSHGVETVTIVAGSGGVVLNQGSSSWTTVSDRNQKHGIEPVNSEAILSGVLAMPVATWTYNSQSDGIRHMGPMAQDFYAAFSLGETNLGINTVDADGVALAAIQGLNAKLERDNAELKAKNAELESRLERIEQTLLGTSGQARR